jgi:hypothetical protein
MEERKRETRRRTLRARVLLRIHKLSRARCGKEKEVKPQIEGT